MKELSIEQKAQRYDEAIKKAKEINNEQLAQPFDVMTRVFPELKESEDEDVRQAMINFFKSERENGIDVLHFGVNIEKMIAWLEKQGEKEYDWSEESYDDARLNDIVSKVECGLQLNKAEINWLKSLKDRVQPQSKQEWSEEDKRKIDRIYFILRQASDTHAFSTSCRLIGDKECIELQDFLKSLRPKPQWKPSDEHIHWLKWATNRMPDTEKANEAEAVLEELLEELKKLTGESYDRQRKSKSLR